MDNELDKGFHAFILTFYLGLDAFLQGGHTQPLCSRVSQGRVQRRTVFACFKLIVLFRADTRESGGISWVKCLGSDEWESPSLH